MTVPPQAARPLLTAQDVHLTAAGRFILTVPHLSLRPGELTHLRGENGAGKTTLLRALAGDLPYQGTLDLHGHPPGSRPARAQTAFVSTEPTLLDDLTVEENLQFMAAAWIRSPEPVLDLARAFGLSPWLDAWPSDLSRGTRQKVALSLFLGLTLPLTLLDEPFSTLDAGSRDVLRQALGERVQSGGSVLLTTHGTDLDGLPHRVLDLHQGELRGAESVA
ncbi:ATP-binding cassette domain-containing protein [Deinococcus sp. SDU3-2]|uniref:ATP-binding cassette domain-containing protein n=1 Tax=Deinococcus terrestris TaxID=2651870 RepID=A0A7X1TQG6_9DEIO|nr:ATP-binding cassette domain-containing protein [Deinococcus terrestris]MPY65411.1 ATP-binding cassette domain-containing protein [Deinococcus terrestris]